MTGNGSKRKMLINNMLARYYCLCFCTACRTGSVSVFDTFEIHSFRKDCGWPFFFFYFLFFFNILNLTKELVYKTNTMHKHRS